MAGKSKGRSRRQHHVQSAFGAKRQWGFQSRSLEPSQDTPHLTMQQQARNTERHSISRSTLQLRHHQVSFVSAGNMLRDDLDDSNLETVNQSLKELNTTSRVASVQEGVVEDQTSPDHYLNEMKMPEAPSQQSQAPDHEQNDGQNGIFFIDLIGDKPAGNAGQPKPETRPRSPTPADSSEDEVVFVGRNKSKLRQSPVDKWACPKTPPVQYMTGSKESAQGIQCQYSEIPEVNEAKTSPEIAHSKLAGIEDMGVGDDSEMSIDFGGGSRRRRRRGRRARQRRQERNDEELILADYIANMQNEESSEDQSSDPSLPAQTVPKTDGLEGINSTMPQKKMVEGHVQEHVQHSLPGRSNEFDNLDDLSTSDEIPDEIGHIFSKRRRGVEVQYLVTGKDQVPDDARWILKEHLIMTGAGEQIEEFDSNGNLRSGFNDDGSGSPSTDFEFNDHLSEAGVEGEDILSGEGQEGLSDEQLARLFERQEKFGLGADDWKWAQDSGASDSERCLDTSFQQKRPSRKSKRNKKPHFPPAGAFADALDQDPYHGFDVMDFERPSLRKKPKRGQQALDYALSDSELEWELYQAWENDRTKKKAKKREREELRAQGLLGKQGKMGTGEKFSDPITTDDLKNKIKAFLVSPSESLSLPPMDKKDRKLVHDLADAVSLKSQSRGGGASRFPMLYKTARTPSFDNVSIVDVDKIFSSGRFTRRTGGRKGFGGNARKPVKPQRSGASAAASYMEGDVVGASAPEIGVENRGRAMLEKMGWSTGTALGATDNKGILKPLAQVVKNTKAGLG